MKHIYIIGAGGVASYLLPVLIKTFKPQQITLVDKDILEERNLDRQLFNPALIGTNKAQALACTAISEKDNVNVTIVDQWFTESTPVPDDVDAIVCCADNHAARFAAIEAAKRMLIYAYVGGNELLDSQAFIAHHTLTGNRDPLVRYPNIATDLTGSPIRCTGEAQEASPQLAVANMNCAAKLLHLMWVYEVWLPEARNQGLTAAAAAGLPVELFTSLTENGTVS